MLAQALRVGGVAPNPKEALQSPDLGLTAKQAARHLPADARRDQSDVPNLVASKPGSLDDMDLNGEHSNAPPKVLSAHPRSPRGALAGCCGLVGDLGFASARS